MSEQPLFSFRNPWFSTSVGVTAAIAVLAALAGLIWLPLAQPDLKLSGIWDAICSAAGVPRVSSQATAIQPDFKTSKVVMTSEMLTRPDQVSIGRGATLAQRCAICHGPQGVSDANSPNLAGQFAAVTYKELNDFKIGARVNVVMSPFAATMSNQDMLDVAAYYAYLPRVPSNNLDPKIPAPLARRPVGGLYQGAAARLCVRQPPQRHQSADAQHRPPDDGGGDRPGRPLLRSPALTGRRAFR
jgi:cytochrome c553